MQYLFGNNNIFKKTLWAIKENGVVDTLRKVKSTFRRLVCREVVSYKYFIPKKTILIEDEISSFVFKPLISVIMPVYNVSPKYLQKAIKSIFVQWYTNWEICICDDASTNKKTLKYLGKIRDHRIKIFFSKQNKNISGASNEALKMAKGEYIALMDNDDEIAPNAFYEVVKAINKMGAEFIYSDEDKLEINGKHVEPHYKPDYSYEMLNSQNYISHLGVIKKTLIDRVGGFEKGLEGAQDYDLYLKVLEQTNKIHHIQKVLYHWRKITGSTASSFDFKNFAQRAGRNSLQNAIIRQGIDGVVIDGKYPGTYRVKYNIKESPLISIIIPFKDKPELLSRCIKSIIEKSTYAKFEIIGVSNNSKEIDTFREIESLEKLDNRISFYEHNIEFNFSEINNYAVKNYANGEYIVLLNNDVEIISNEWIENMLMMAQKERVGAVGAILYYPDETIQHAGVIVGLGGIAGHAHCGLKRNCPGYFARAWHNQNISAVTAACLMINKEKYLEVEGLDEVNLKVAFNDVDFCLRLIENGYENVYTPFTEAYHYESITRGCDTDIANIDRFKKEINYMRQRHAKILSEGDPYYNSNLSLIKNDFSLRAVKKKQEREKLIL